MSAVPRQEFSIQKHPYGVKTAGTWVESGTCRSLLLSMPHHRLKDGQWSGGGPFFQVTDEINHGGEQFFPGYTKTIWYPERTAIGVSPSAKVPIRFLVLRPKDMLAGWSARNAMMMTYVPAGYHRTRPGNPIASVGQFLVELRDLPKIPLVQGRDSYVSMFKRGYSLPGVMAALRDQCHRFVRAYRARDVGSEWLNIVFGWKPFVNDIRKAYSLWSTVDRQMAQIVRDNGKGIRRSTTLSDTSEVLSSDARSWNYPGVNVYGFPPDYINGIPGGSTDWAQVSTKKEKVWYVAKYRYWIPDVSSSQWTSKAKAVLFGAYPTPEVVWSVTPWSWLIDWAVNMGDVVSNMSTNAVENLVQQYSYTMCTTTYTNVNTSNCVWGGRQGCWAAGSFGFKSTYTQTIKSRGHGGSPYALNAVSGAPLNGHQIGVLAALGISLA